MKFNAKHNLMSILQMGVNLKELATLLLVAGFMTSCGFITQPTNYSGQAEFMDNSSGAASGNFGSSGDATAGSMDDFEMDAILDKLNSDIAAIQQQIVALQEADDAINSRIDDLEKALDDFKKAMEEEIAALKAKDTELQGDLAALEARINVRIDAEVALLDQAIAGIKDDISDLEDVDAEIKADMIASLEDLETDLKDYTNAGLADLEERLSDDLEDVRKDLQAKLDANRAEMLSEIARLDAAIEGIQGRLDGLDTSLAGLQADLDATSVEQWDANKATASTILEGYAAEAAVVGLSEDDAGSGVATARTNLAGFDTSEDNPSRKADFEAILAEIEAVKGKVKAAAEAYRDSQNRAIADINDRIKASEDAHDALVLDMGNQFAVVNGKLTDMQNQINAINAQLAQLALITARLDALETHTGELQAAVDSINDNFTPEVLADIEANKNAIKMNKEAINTLTLAVAAINATIQGIQEDILGLKIGDEEVAMLQGVLDSYKADTGAIFTEFQTDEGKQTELGAKIEWITEISVRYQATSTHYQKGIAELIALFRSKEMQSDAVGDAITAVETDFTSYMVADVNNKEVIRAKMQDYTDELTKLRTDLDNLQAAHDALAADAVKRDEFDSAIAELKAADAALATDIENALQAAKDYTDEAINSYKAEVADMFDGMGEEIQQTAAALASDIADLQVKNKSLEERHNVLEGRVDNMVLTQERMAELAEKREKAEAAYDLFLRALFELEGHAVQVWDPVQGSANWADYLVDFKANVMDPRAVNPEVCGIEIAASFPNSIGLDAQRILAMEVVNRVWRDNDPDGTLQNIAGQTTMLNRYPAGEASDPNCLSEAVAWAEGVDLNSFHTVKGGDLGLLDALNANADYTALRLRFINTIQAYAQDWSAYQDILAQIHDADGATLADLLAQVAVSMQDQLATKAELELVRSQLQGQIDGMQLAIDGLEAKDDQFEGELADIRNQVAGVDAAYKAADTALQAQIDAIPDPNVPAGVSEGMADLIAIVAEIAKRSGYADLALDAEQIGTTHFADTFDEDKYRMTPKFVEIQHFFSDLYNDLADGVLRDADGNPVASISTRWASHTTNLMRHGDRSLCNTNTIGLGQGAAQDRWNSHNGHCRVNFRNNTLRRYHNTAVGNVMFRAIGSAHLALGRSNNGKKLMVPFVDADDITFQAGNAVQGGAYSEAPVVPVDSVVVHGSPFAGVFDFFPTELLMRPSGAGNAYYDIQTYFTPVSYEITGQQDIGGGITTYNYEFTEGAEVGHRVELYSPIVLDFISASDKVRTLQHANGVKFDLDANGKAERTGWVDGLDGAFLALDLNKNGKIDDGSELFGQSTILENGQKAAHGYEALAHYDANKDGKIDAKDPVFKDLVVWFDKNVDGVSQKHEIYSLQDRDVTALSVSYTELAGGTGFDKGNLVKYKAKFFGPKSCPEDGCNSYDIFFGASVELNSK
ncbi:MAG: hypothetical protein HRU09_04325 [Oligoflexales bacterium]|nr:hypothetical protein [Oligoflexales bacterium]